MLGAFPWCLLLSFLGYRMGKNREKILQYAHLPNYAILVIVAMVIIAAILLYVLVKLGLVEKGTVMRYLSLLTHI